MAPVCGSFQALRPVASPMKFSTVFGASSVNRRAVNDPLVVTKCAYVPVGSLIVGVAGAEGAVPRAAGVAGGAGFACVAGFAGVAAGGVAPRRAGVDVCAFAVA